MTKIAIVDTSSIIFGFSYKKDVFNSLYERFPDYKPAVSNGVINELARFSLIKGKKGIAAKIGLLTLKSKNVRVYKNNTSVDSWIIRQAGLDTASIVISNDTALNRILSKRHVPCFKMSKSGMLKRSFG